MRWYAASEHAGRPLVARLRELGRHQRRVDQLGVIDPVRRSAERSVA